MNRPVSAVEVAPVGGLDRAARVALYSHDTVGLGHIRRNLRIARSLVESGASDRVLLLSGASEAHAFPRPPGVELMTVPSLRKSKGRYCSRSLRISIEDITRLRSASIRAAVSVFRPDVLIVDKVPRGAADELVATLEDLRATGTRCVLGLRDVLDSKQRVAREWLAARSSEAVARYFDEVWVYGDPRVFDPVREYDLPDEVASKVRYVGYLGPDPAVESSNGRHPDGRYTLCMVGGGEDGDRLARAFADVSFDGASAGVLVPGPYMDPRTRAELADRAAANSKLHVMGFTSEPGALIAHADRVVSMGGYNSLCEILSLGKRALIVPREAPRLEQLIRAERFRDRGLIDVCRSADLSPKEIQRWLESDRPRPLLAGRIDIGGLSRIAELLGTPQRLAIA